MIKEIFESIFKALKELGKGQTVLLIILALLVVGILNYKKILLDSIEIYETFQLQRHNDKMKKRDMLLSELDISLREMRAATEADRLLYFEYHNSKENLVGIPFKYVDLVMAEKKYGVPGVTSARYRDINAGLITNLYEDMVKQRILLNDASEEFFEKYSDAADFLGTEFDPDLHQMFINIPGREGNEVSIGMIVLEWAGPDPDLNWEKVKDKIENICLPRINTIIGIYSKSENDE